jgi:hypothetical protein
MQENRSSSSFFAERMSFLTLFDEHPLFNENNPIGSKTLFSRMPAFPFRFMGRLIQRFYFNTRKSVIVEFFFPGELGERRLR